MMELPKYCKIVDEPQTGKRLVQIRNKGFLANFGTTPYETDDDVIQNFWDWVRRNPALAVQVC